MNSELTEQKINNFLDDLIKDRQNLFNKLRNSKEENRKLLTIQEQQLTLQDSITRAIIKYKSLLKKIDIVKETN